MPAPVVALITTLADQYAAAFYANEIAVFLLSTLGGTYHLSHQRLLLYNQIIPVRLFKYNHVTYTNGFINHLYIN